MTNANKARLTAALNKSDYIEKVLNLLKDRSTYETLKIYFIPSVQRECNVPL